MVNISKRNLRPLTAREQTEELIANLKATLQEVPKYKRSDFEKLLIDYEKDLKSKEFADKTISKYVRNAKWFIENYTNDNEYLTKDDVIEFKSFIQSEYDKISTINNYITTVNRFLFYCEQGAFKVDKVKGQNSNVLEHRIYDYEYVRMYNKAKAVGQLELHFIIKLIGSTGIRINELKSFTVESIKGTSVNVNHKGKIRAVPVPGPLMRELRKFARDTKKDKEVFTLSYDKIYYGLKQIAGLCKVKKNKVHPHAFRHYFSFKFVEKKGAQRLAQLADILGHSSIETTRVYTRGTLEDYKKDMEEM